MQLLLAMYTIVLSNAKNSIIMMDNDDAKLIKSKQLGKYGKARSKPQYQIRSYITIYASIYTSRLNLSEKA